MVKMCRPALAAFFGGFQRAGVVVLAVGEQHQHLVVVAFLEGGQGRLDGLGERRAALGDRVHVERLDALPEGRVVDRQRALQEGAAGEGHQAEPVGLGPLHQIQRGQFGARQPVGRDVLRQHALGGVDGHDDVQSALLDFLPVKAPLRPRQRQNQAGHRQDQAAQPDLLARRRKCRPSSPAAAAPG